MKSEQENGEAQAEDQVWPFVCLEANDARSDEEGGKADAAPRLRY